MCVNAGPRLDTEAGSIPWPDDAVIIVAANAGEEIRERMQGIHPCACRRCGQALHADTFALQFANGLPSRLGRPVQFFCVDCAVQHDRTMIDDLHDHRHRTQPQPHEPIGIGFYDVANQREMKLVTSGPGKGWLAYKHVDGQWVTLRKPSEAEVWLICDAIWPAGQQFRICRPLVANVPKGAQGWEQTTCDICGAACWKMATEPDELPPNVTATCTGCALTNRQKAEA